MDLGLSGKLALVTGASSGIGAATASLLAADGADVIISYSANTAGAERTAAEVRSRGRQATLLQMDVGDPQAVSSALAELGPTLPGLDVAILCAGVNTVTPFEQLTPFEWDDVVRVNLSGTFYVLHAILPLLRDDAAVVTVASVAANTGAPHHAHYAAAKAGVVGLTKSAARALAPRVRVNCVSPGLTITPMGELTLAGLAEGYAESKLLAGRVATPTEIAHCIVFLASPASAFVYGACLDVNGGRDLR
ncbi:MAG: SDR family oxidoreductase [Chloroflexota bacterium]|nr:SDR family oxidoreductase [Chloroflexota bacterium]